MALAAAVSLASGVPFVIVRKEQKDYGTNKAIEGVINPGERVVLLEDVLTTAGEALRSAANAMQTITAQRAAVNDFFGRLAA